jgi:hypothetical protein
MKQEQYQNHLIDTPEAKYVPAVEQKDSFFLVP